MTLHGAANTCRMRVAVVAVRCMAWYSLARLALRAASNTPDCCPSGDVQFEPCIPLPGLPGPACTGLAAAAAACGASMSTSLPDAAARMPGILGRRKLLRCLLRLVYLREACRANCTGQMRQYCPCQQRPLRTPQRAF